MARLLVNVVRERKLVKRISGNEYLLAPGWAVLAGMTGLAPYTAWTRPLEDGTGYLARVEVRRIADGAVIAAAEQICTRSEAKWANADDHALLGMAQTRASSRALRGPLMQIVELAGYKGTPAEEMPVVDAYPQKPRPSERSLPDEVKPTAEQKKEINALLRTLAQLDPGTDWPAPCVDIIGMTGKEMTQGYADILIRKLQQHLDEVNAPDPNAGEGR
jgi:hypothetical protein